MVSSSTNFGLEFLDFLPQFLELLLLLLQQFNGIGATGLNCSLLFVDKGQSFQQFRHAI